MNIYQSIKDFGKKALVTGGLVAVLSGCSDGSSPSPRRIGQIVEDFNNDKRSDIVAVSFDRDAETITKGELGSFDAYISLGQKDGTFSSQKKAFHFELNPINLQVGDINGDGNKDLIFIAHDRDAETITKGELGSFDQYVALGNGDGTFQNPKKTLHYDTIPRF